jgi:hypothetical protein
MGAWERAGSDGHPSWQWLRVCGADGCDFDWIEYLGGARLGPGHFAELGAEVFEAGGAVGSAGFVDSPEAAEVMKLPLTLIVAL